MDNENKEKIIYKDLSYKLQGLFFDIRNDLGSGHKESIYQKALEKELIRAGIKFIKEPPIKIYSKKNEFLGLYRPDFLIEDKIIVELKAIEHISKQETARVYDYLRNSKYELAYLVNFASLELFIRRLIFTNDRKPSLKLISKFLAVFFVVISFSFIAIRGVNAADVFFDANKNNFAQNEDFLIKVFLDTKDNTINALEGTMAFSPEYLELKEIRDGNSSINFWIERPHSVVGGKIVFSGITAGGFSGPKMFLFGLVFRTKKIGESTILFDNMQILQNDGLGTKVPAKATPFTFSVSKEFRGTTGEDLAIKDANSPENFNPFIGNDPSIFDGKYFIVFSTVDKGVGIDHYEVRESPWFFLGIWGGKYITTESPYLLKDQTLKSKIYIKAIDKAQNEREVKLGAQNKLAWLQPSLVLSIIILVAYIFGFKKIWLRFTQ
ncbi:MAG: GxxExxY protein [Patescibacteria group bacterium]